LRAALERRFPAERGAIERYFALLAEANAAIPLFFAEKAVPRPVAWLLGGLMRRRALSFARQTTLEVLESLTRDRTLIALLSAQWGDYGLPPSESSFFMHALVAQHYLRGAAYPVGGSERIAECIAPLIEERGGQLVTSAEVARVVVEGGRAVGVALADGRVLRAPIVVSAAGVATTA